MAQQGTIEHTDVTSHAIGIRKIGVNDLWQALKEGFDDYYAKPTHFAFLFLIYPLFAVLLTLFLVGQNMLHLAFPIVAGLTLLGPVVSVALMEMSRRREQGLEVSWRSAFEFVHTGSFAGILALSIAMALLYVAWLYMAQFIYLGLFGAVPLESVGDFVNQLFTTKRGGALIVYGTALGAIFAIVAMAISVVAFPLLLDGQVSGIRAIQTSIKAVTSNALMMAIWGLVVVALLAAGAVIFLVGLVVVLPVLGHATWHLYRKLVET
ncbi:MAG: DUF2189 domain-containing protein [Alphaproteobacteria bacterium]|nr:DUF2189 domain-containing protein [Alphaproteobacteria bacterium]